MEITQVYFGLFLGISVLLYHLMPARSTWVVLMGSGLVFLALSSFTALWVALDVIIINYLIGIGQSSIRRKRTLLISAIIINLGFLGIFKYFNILNKFTASFGNWFDFDPSGLFIQLFLPLGISYYIFQAISYQIDIYRGKLLPEQHFGHFASYLIFFPKLTAGPIERPKGFLDQLKTPGITYDDFSDGFRLLLWGFFKKMFISGNIHFLIQPIFDDPEIHGGWPMILASCLYTIQIYADFSGYTDIALGSARLFGINLSQNFNRPLLSRSLTEFWRRWHITLSNWVNDYIYQPLSLWLSINFNTGKWGVLIAVLISFMIIGVWHGAKWTFVAFGAVQALILAAEIVLIKTRKKHFANKVGFRIAGILFTFSVFTFSCLFFKGASMDESISWISSLVDFQNPLPRLTWSDREVFILLAVPTFLIIDHLIMKNGFVTWCKEQHPIIRWMVYGVLIYAVLAGPVTEVEPFIYEAY